MHQVILAGAGGIAEAAALLLAEWSPNPAVISIGNRTLAKAQHVAAWVEAGVSKPCNIRPFHLPETALGAEAERVFRQGGVLLDCLPGGQAPRMARLARDFGLHYVNLTEYVAETEAIVKLAQNAGTGFVLQTGLAPGYINVLAHGLFQQFCTDYGVENVDKLEMKVGALSDHAVAPHFYGFTWSPVGVATEYVKNAQVLRNYQVVERPSLSERSRILIDGVAYEDDLTSGGAADLPQALAGKVRSLDYKTLRHPGHYAWVQEQLSAATGNTDTIAALQHAMEAAVPHLEDDRVVLYAAVEGRDAGGVLRRRETARLIRPMTVGKHRLRAIQTTTAAPMLECAMMLLEGKHRGVVLQSRLDPKRFLEGYFVKKVYG